MLYRMVCPEGLGNEHEREHEAGRRLLQYALEEEYGIKELPALEIGEHGKPYLREYRQIHFNISHSRGLVVCAVGEKELGVDIERLRQVTDSVKKRVLSGKEQEWLELQKDRDEAFIRLWTLKEAYVKAAGTGLSKELSSLEFTLPEEGRGGEILCNEPGCSFFQKRLRDAFLAVCIMDRQIPQEFEKQHIIF